MSPTAHPLWFGPPERPLLGWFHLPDGGSARGAVVLCPPVGDEERRTYVPYRKLADSLAAEGLAVLRFSYDGTGDSAGTLDDPDRVASWLASIASAVQLVRDAGLERVGAIGMRLGATLLSRAAVALDEPLDAVVLWDPCVTGREFARYQKALMGSLPGEAVADETGFDTPGFFFTTPLVDELNDLEIAPQHSGATRTLVLVRPDRSATRLERALDGSKYEVGEALGQEDLLDVAPLSAQVPWATIRHLTAWTGTHLDGSEAAVVVPTATVATVDSGHDGMPIRERITRLGDLGLFAIVTEPEDGGHGPWNIFLNVATEHHIGPGRQWVELARAWARHGLRSVRVDFSGVGDSPVRQGQAENATYAPQWLDDLEIIASGVSPEDPSDTTWIGLCSGAYGALEAALTVGGKGAYVFNPTFVSPSMNKASPQADPRRKAFRPYPVPIVRLSVNHRRVAQSIWGLCMQFAVWRAPMAVPHSAVRAGVDVLIISSPDDAEPLQRSWYWRYVGVPRLERTGRYRLAVPPDLDHVLLFSKGRTEAVQILSRHVFGRYGDGAREARALVEGAGSNGAVPGTATPDPATGPRAAAPPGSAESDGTADRGSRTDGHRPGATAST